MSDSNAAADRTASLEADDGTAAAAAFESLIHESSNEVQLLHSATVSIVNEFVHAGTIYNCSYMYDVILCLSSGHVPSVKSTLLSSNSTSFNLNR